MKKAKKAHTVTEYSDTAVMPAVTIPARIREGIRKGDEAAFAEYYEGVQDALVTFIGRLVGDGDEALNIAHDAFVKLWEKREQIDRLNGFIYTAATNGALDVLRKKRVHARYLGEQLHIQDGEEGPADRDVIVGELMARIEKTVEGMPSQRQKVFRMSREENLTYNEIAERLDISYYTVKDHIETALASLRGIVMTIVMLAIIS